MSTSFALLALGIVVVAAAWGLTERNHEYREVLGGVHGRIIEAVQGLLVIILFALNAAVFGFCGWKLGIVAVLGSFAVAAIFRPRDVCETLERRAPPVRKADSRAVARALRDARIREVLASHGLTKDDLAALLIRFHALGVSPREARRGIRNSVIIEWCLSRPDPKKITFEESLELLRWLRRGARR